MGRPRLSGVRRGAWKLGLSVTLTAAAVAIGPLSHAVGADSPTGNGSAAECAHADALLSLGRLPAAEKAYEKELEANPGATCARGGLKALSSGGECAAAGALLDSGEDAEAQKAYIEVLKAAPESECAAQGVEEAADPTVWEDIATVSSDAVTALGGLGLAIGAVAIVLLALVNLLARLPWFKSHWPVARIRRPTVSVEPLDDSGLKDQKLGIAVAALMRERIEPGSAGSALKVVSGTTTTEETWIERVSEIGEQGKIAAAVIGLLASLLPRQHVKVTGELQPAADPTGPGIGLELYRKLQSRGSVTFWASQFQLPTGEDIGTMRRLAVPAAAWVSHMVTKETEGETMGSADPTSWALFKAAVEQQGEGDLGAALWLYLEALAYDAQNYGALANLAGIEAASGDYRPAIERLQKAIAILKEQ
jgi:tetratricopeptide (TPR) repeat protein